MIGTEWLRCPCGARFQRPRHATYDRCLGCVIGNRLRASGIGPDDPGITIARRWNAIVYRTAEAVAA